MSDEITQMPITRIVNGKTTIDGETVNGFKKAKSYGCKRQSYPDRDERFRAQLSWRLEEPFEFYTKDQCYEAVGNYYGRYARGTATVLVPRPDATPMQIDMNNIIRINRDCIVIKRKEKEYRVLVGYDLYSDYAIKWNDEYWFNERKVGQTLNEEKKRFCGTTPIVFMSQAYEFVGKNEDGRWVFIKDMKEYNQYNDMMRNILMTPPEEMEQVIQEYRKDLQTLATFDSTMSSFIHNTPKYKFHHYGNFQIYHFNSIRNEVERRRKDIIAMVEFHVYQKDVLKKYQSGEITFTEAKHIYYKRE